MWSTLWRYADDLVVYTFPPRYYFSFCPIATTFLTPIAHPAMATEGAADQVATCSSAKAQANTFWNASLVQRVYCILD